MKKHFIFKAAEAYVVSQLAALKQIKDSPFARTCGGNRLRGIDFYQGPALVKAMTTTTLMFHRAHGCFPNFVTPSGFNEKIVWRKFFSEFVVPYSGNKLFTSRFIPEPIADQLRCPPIVWQSNDGSLPDNDALAPGHYYLKANHGSGMFSRVSFPLDDDQRTRLVDLSRKWLATDYGLNDGEWWYNVFERTLILEKDVSTGDGSISFNMHVFDGEIEFIAMYRKTTDGDECTWLDNNFLEMSIQNQRPRVRNAPSLSGEIKDQLKYFTRQIGRNSPFLRVDFLVGENDEIHLLEITFTPGNGLSRRPALFDLYLGSRWVEAA